MTDLVSGMNPEVLKWARERAGYSVADVAHALKKDIDVIESWESGADAPTYGQLEKLAYQLYKRPIALFFFPAPPEEPDPKQSFRTLPEFELQNLASDTRFAIRQAEAMQLALNELNDGANPAQKKIFREVQIDINSDIVSAVARVRDYLGLKLEEQSHWKDSDDALKKWRSAVEETGVFVFKRSFHQRDISGFCLLDVEFPVIYINNSAAKTRQIFTLFHELAHILLHSNGITKRDFRYIDALTGYEKQIEVFCNRFAGEFIVPSSDFEQWIKGDARNDEYISKLANTYKVSREAILRKFLDRKLVDQNYYEAKAKQWADEYENARKSAAGGGDYYATQAIYLGDRFLNLAFARYYQGRCTL